MLLAILLGLVFVCAVGPAVLFCVNLRAYAQPRTLRAEDDVARVAVLIPARNEEANIDAALRAVLSSECVDLEVLVMDDVSTDRTAEIVSEIAARDARVRLLRGGELPQGWNGKQHACWRLAQESTAPVMLFLDADVRVEPECIARMAAFQRASGAALVSGFARLITISWLEKLLLPLIHFVLLSFLPIARMRETTQPSMAAGCGQFLMANRAAYFKCGGHEAIRATMHDGLKLPRAFRQYGFRTDLADATDLASVRMYRNAREVWNGLAKNATEGIGAPARIVPFTLLLVLGQMAPVVVLSGIALECMMISIHYTYVYEIRNCWKCWIVTLVIFMAAIATYVPRLLAVQRFRQPLASAMLHPFGIGLLLCVQWYALLRQLFGRPVGWRQREYASATSGEKTNADSLRE